MQSTRPTDSPVDPVEVREGVEELSRKPKVDEHRTESDEEELREKREKRNRSSPREQNAKFSKRRIDDEPSFARSSIRWQLRKETKKGCQPVSQSRKKKRGFGRDHEERRGAKLTDVGLVVERFVESDGSQVEEPDAV